MQVMVSFSIAPLGKGEHVAEAVARAVRIIRESGLEHELGPSGTTILGDWDRVFAVIKKCHEEVARDAPRVTSLIKVDQADGLKPGAIKEKVRHVEALLARGAPPAR